jgi:hypothetical protein
MIIQIDQNTPTANAMVVNNLITETLATRRVDFLVVGTFYRVASVGITTGAQWNLIGAIIDGESVPVIGRLFKCLQVGLSVEGGGTCYDVEYTNIVSLADPTSVRIRDAYGDPITTTAGNLNVNLNAVNTANSLNVKVNPTSSQAVRITGLGNTALLISTGGLCYGTSLINKSSTINCWLKFYVKSTAPTFADTPFLIQYLEYVAQYNLNSHNDDWFNMPIGSKLWVRATLLPNDVDTMDTLIDAEATIFIGS